MKDRFIYPLTHPSTLTPDAQAVYFAQKEYYGRLDHDPFTTAEETKVDTQKQQEGYQPTERFFVAADELEAHGLGRYDRNSGSLATVRVHPLYTVARGRGMYIAQVSLVSTDRVPTQGGDGVSRLSAQDKLLLGTFIGADFNYRGYDDGWQMWRLEAGHDTATDAGHQRARVGMMVVANPVITESSGGVTIYTGTLTSARLYRPGTDPLTVADRYTTPGVCVEEDEPHPFAPLLPPERGDLTALVPSLVTVVLHSLDSCEVED